MWRVKVGNEEVSEYENGIRVPFNFKEVDRFSYFPYSIEFDKFGTVFINGKRYAIELASGNSRVKPDSVTPFYYNTASSSVGGGNRLNSVTMGYEVLIKLQEVEYEMRVEIVQDRAVSLKVNIRASKQAVGSFVLNGEGFPFNIPEGEELLITKTLL